MTYTPINWQTGDTITAEKMNKMDNGWGVESTQLFSETVTTEAGEYGNEGQLTYSSQVTSPAITVTFGGTDYQCSAIQIEAGVYGYGGVTSEWIYDFTTYPFAFVSSSHDGNVLATSAAGTYAFAVATDVAVVSDGFAAAVAVVSTPELFIAISNATTWQEIYDAIAAGKDVRINSASGSSVYSEPVYSATFDGTYYEVAAFFINGGAAAARYYLANSANSPIYPN